MNTEKSDLRIRDTRRSGHFWAYNSILDCYGPLIGAFGFAVYMALCRHARSGKVGISLRQLARSLDMSVGKVHQSIDVLATQGLIAVQESSDPGHQEPNTYDILETEEGVHPMNTSGNQDSQGVHDMNTGVHPMNWGVHQVNANKEERLYKTINTNPPYPPFEISAQQAERRERERRDGLKRGRQRGLRDFAKHPIEDWEAPLSEAEKAKSA